MAIATDFIAAVIIVAWGAKACVDINGSIAGVRAGIALGCTGTGARLTTVMAERACLACAVIICPDWIAYTIVAADYSALRDVAFVAHVSSA
jgi:hypothetical protein